MEKQIKIEWCENFIRSYFKKYKCRGVYTELLFNEAAKAGLYIPGTYGSSFSLALMNTTNVETIHDDEGKFLYNIFTLK